MKLIHSSIVLHVNPNSCSCRACVLGFPTWLVLVNASCVTKGLSVHSTIGKDYSCKVNKVYSTIWQSRHQTLIVSHVIFHWNLGCTYYQTHEKKHVRHTIMQITLVAGCCMLDEIPVWGCACMYVVMLYVYACTYVCNGLTIEVYKFYVWYCLSIHLLVTMITSYSNFVSVCTRLLSTFSVWDTLGACLHSICCDKYIKLFYNTLVKPIQGCNYGCIHGDLSCLVSYNTTQIYTVFTVCLHCVG